MQRREERCRETGKLPNSPLQSYSLATKRASKHYPQLPFPHPPIPLPPSSYTIPATPTTTPPSTTSNLTTPVGAAFPELTVNGPTACVFAVRLSVVMSGGAGPVFELGTISLFDTRLVIGVAGVVLVGLMVCGGANSVLAVRAVV